MDLEEVVRTAIDQGGAAVVLASHSRSVNFRLANNTVTTNGREESTAAGVVAIEADRVAVQAADVQQRSQVLELSGEARRLALASPQAPDAMPLLLPGEAAAAVPMESLVEADEFSLEPILGPIKTALDRSRRDGLELYGYAQLSREDEHLGTRTGVSLPGRRQVGSVSMTLKTGDLKRSVWAGRQAVAMDRIDVAAMYQGMRERLEWTQRQISLEPGHYEVILEASATADMLMRLAWEMQARGADEERTVFAAPGGSRVGERMYATGVNIESDPDDPGMRVPGFVRCLRSSEYSSVFDNGLAAGPMTWVDQGVQQDLICPRRWALDHGHPVRPEAENLRMRGTQTSLEEMISVTERALLITSFWYIRDVDPSTLLLTGLTRDGVFLIEHGQVVGAVNNFRFNESPVGVLARTTQIGRAEMALSREVGDAFFIEAPPIRVEGFFMSSASDAV